MDLRLVEKLVRSLFATYRAILVSTILCMAVTYVISFGINFSNCFYVQDKCPNENISFWLYTRETKSDPVRISVDDFQEDLFISIKPMIVLVHGYTGHKDFSPNTQIRPAILKAHDIFVLSLDYNPLVREPCYVEASHNIKTVARCTANLLDVLIEKELINLNELHVIGFSLGGHVAGMIANFLRAGRLKRITGLDPANPLFTYVTNENRLDAGDAEFVDVIHTDVRERGIFFQVGHLDFYPNRGLDQPGCRMQNVTSPGSCNHNRAPMYYAESINSKIGFWAYECENWFYHFLGICRWSKSRKTTLMGYYALASKRGSYFLETNMEPPYAKGSYPHTPLVKSLTVIRKYPLK